MNDRSEPDFAALGAPKALAAALTERDYLTPTPVQASVLAAADADLLVSSQTGSGKTVAFGLVIGRLLLGESETLAHNERPRALVVAPTRELAAQVQRELEWLFARTGARIASFTGGTDLRGDARSIRRGVDIAVGTPGRLVDLITRKALDLSGIEVAVLDEADEMLDLGFRESLEAILEAAPPTRRTLLFSATLPQPIRALAKKFQKDAVAVDPRAGGGAPAAHEDIRHVAHLCADGDRLAALVNVLRLADDDRAIVFCRTRENVSELHTQLTARGFAATAISGDRAQEDRTRALEAVRKGKVRVLVATNVAARGLDLPDVGLVVHADLPENAEALTHRSGRTGRAGNKGVNTFIVEMSARRRAERLFRDAHLKLAWTAPPDAAAVTAHDRARLVADLEVAITQPRDAASTALAEQLLADHDAVAAVALLLERALAGRPAGEKLKAVELRAAAPSRTGGPAGGFVLFEVNLGSKDSADAKWILPLVCRRGGITRREVGAIRIARDRTYVEVAGRAAAEFAANAAERDPRAPHVVIGPSQESLPSKSTYAPPRPSARSQGDRPAPRHAAPTKPAAAPKHAEAHAAPKPADAPATTRPAEAPAAAKPAERAAPKHADVAATPRRAEAHAPSEHDAPAAARPAARAVEAAPTQPRRDEPPLPRLSEDAPVPVAARTERVLPVRTLADGPPARMVVRPRNAAAPAKPYGDKPRSSTGAPRSYGDKPSARTVSDRPPSRTASAPAAGGHPDRPPPRSFSDRPRAGAGGTAPPTRAPAKAYGARSDGSGPPSRTHAERPPGKSYDRAPAKSYDRAPAKSYDRAPTKSYGERAPTRGTNRPPARSHGDGPPARSHAGTRPPARGGDRPPARGSYGARPPAARGGDRPPARGGHRPSPPKGHPSR